MKVLQPLQLCQMVDCVNEWFWSLLTECIRKFKLVVHWFGSKVKLAIAFLSSSEKNAKNIRPLLFRLNCTYCIYTGTPWWTNFWLFHFTVSDLGADYPSQVDFCCYVNNQNWENANTCEISWPPTVFIPPYCLKFLKHLLEWLCTLMCKIDLNWSFGTFSRTSNKWFSIGIWF